MLKVKYEDKALYPLPLHAVHMLIRPKGII